MLGKRVLRLSAVAIAAGLAMATSGVYAQSNATGTVYGTVAAAASGSVVTVENLSTGAKRTVTPDGTGRYQLTSLPPGRYKVSLVKSDKAIGSQLIEVLIGQSTEATFVDSGATAQLDTVQVVGARRLIDTQATNSVSTFTATQLAALPIAQDLTSIILLAPDTVKADPRYAGGASIGGGAPSENSYYINGFPVTNALSQLGSIELPFGAIDQANVMTGGFGAEFGRSTGGVMNIITKSGGNKWEGGVFASVSPASLTAAPKSIYFPASGVLNGAGKPFDGTLYLDNHANTTTEYKYGGYLGGPLIQDKLFMFVAVDQTRTHDSNSYANSEATTDWLNGWAKSKSTNDRWLAKFDWNISDDHRLELTTLGDNYATNTDYYGFNYNTLQRGSAVQYSAHYRNDPSNTPAVGGQATMLKYTGNLTQNLVLTALYGQSITNHGESYGNFAPGVTTALPGLETRGAGAAPGVDYTSYNPLTATDVPPVSAQDKSKAARVDLEWTLGNHTLRAGIDQVKLTSSNAGSIEAGGGTWRFLKTSPTAVKSAGPYSFVVGTNDPTNPLAQAGYYVRKHIFADTTDATSDQRAQYIEDRWQVNKKLFLQLGLRNEGFSGTNGEGKKYLDSKNFLSPRLASAYDVYGDGDLKLSGSLGRYSIQTPTHLAVRGASVSTLTYQFYTYSGIDPVTHQPVGLKPLTPAPYSPDGETGLPKDPATYAPSDLKPSYQDEIVLGFEKALSPKFVGGMKATYRVLRNTLDDDCDPRPLENYAKAHGIDYSNWPAEPAFNDGICYLVNPGRNNTLKVDYAGTGSNYTTVTLSPADLGFAEKPKRTFLALDFFLEHPFADGWYGKVTYTYSKNKGNTEGQTKSDIGQTDVSATETWDHPELMEGSYGYLPNDRTHQIHAYGYYQATPEWGVGGNFTAQSGRPKNCFGNYGGTGNLWGGDIDYGSAYFYCSFDGGKTSVPTPRGSQGRLPWDVTMDMNVVYKPSRVKGLTLRMDVFNLFNKQTVQAINEVHETDYDSTSLLETYGMPVSYSKPRVVKFTAQYEF